MDIEKEQSSKNTCPFLITNQIIEIFGKVATKLELSFQRKILREVMDKMFMKIGSISNQEIKDINTEDLMIIFGKLDVIFDTFDKETISDLYKQKEYAELRIYLRLLDNPKLEYKFKGLSGIEDYADAVEAKLKEYGWTTQKNVQYFDRGSFLEWLFDNKVIELIYTKYQHMELIKRSLKIQIFIAERSEDFPESLIGVIWRSCQNFQEETLKVVYHGILELAHSLNIQAVVSFLNKFSMMSDQDYDKDFVHLFCKFTTICIESVMTESNGVFKLNPDVSKKYPDCGFGVIRMYELVIDGSSLNSELSNEVLICLLQLMERYYVSKPFVKIVKKCFKNIKDNKSLYQSLALSSQFFSSVQSNSGLKHINEQIFSNKIQNDVLEDLFRSYYVYYEEVRKQIKALKMSSNKIELGEDNYIHKKFVGKFTHQQNITQVIKALKALTIHSASPEYLSYDHFQQLWIRFVVKPNSNFEKQLFLDTISQKYEHNSHNDLYFINAEDFEKAFSEIICNRDFFMLVDFTMEKFKCLEFYFLTLNFNKNKVTIKNQNKSHNLQLTSSDIFVEDIELEGISTLWNYFTECSNLEITEKLSNLLIDVYSTLSPELVKNERTIFEKVITDVMDSIEELANIENLEAIEKYTEFLDKFLDNTERKPDRKAFEKFIDDGLRP